MIKCSYEGFQNLNEEPQKPIFSVLLPKKRSDKFCGQTEQPNNVEGNKYFPK